MMRLNGYGYTRRAIADQLSVPVEELDRVARRELDGDPYVDALQGLLDRGRPAPGDIPKPQGLKVTGAEHIPAQPAPAPEAAKPGKAGDGKPLSRDESISLGEKLPRMLRESFDQMDQTLVQLTPIYMPDGNKLAPGIWSAITDEECTRLAGLLIEMGRHNIIVAQAVRYAEKYDNIRFVAELMGPRMGATGMYIAGSAQQAQERKRAAKARGNA